jgi:hypothetical protein
MFRALLEQNVYHVSFAILIPYDYSNNQEQLFPDTLLTGLSLQWTRILSLVR